MKKRTIKSLAINKKTISTFAYVENVKGGGLPPTSETSCLCMDTMCKCEIATPIRREA